MQSTSILESQKQMWASDYYFLGCAKPVKEI